MAIWPKLLIAGATTIAGIVAVVAGRKHSARPTKECQQPAKEHLNDWYRCANMIYLAKDHLESAEEMERMAAEKLAAQQAEVEAAKRERITAEQEFVEALRRERTVTEQELAESEKHITAEQMDTESVEGEQNSCNQHFPLKMDAEDAVAEQDAAAEWTDASPVEDDSTKGDAENEF